MDKHFIELNNNIIDKIEEITLTDYGFIEDKIETEKCIDIIEDLIIEYENLLDEYNDFKTYVEDNYSFKGMR